MISFRFERSLCETANREKIKIINFVTAIDGVRACHRELRAGSAKIGTADIRGGSRIDFLTTRIFPRLMRPFCYTFTGQ